MLQRIDNMFDQRKGSWQLPFDLVDLVQASMYIHNFLG